VVVVVVVVDVAAAAAAVVGRVVRISAWVTVVTFIATAPGKRVAAFVAASRSSYNLGLCAAALTEARRGRKGG